MNIRCGMGVNSYDDVVNTASVRQMSAISVRSTLSARSGHSPYIIKAPMLGFKDFRCARTLLGGIELMHMIAKGQMQCHEGSNPSAADQFYALAA